MKGTIQSRIPKFYFTRTGYILLIADTILAIVLIVLLLINAGDAIDWSSFIPDLIVGIATGLAVGLILARSQQNVERERQSRNSRASWLALRPKLDATPAPIGDMGLDFRHDTLSDYLDRVKPLYKRLEKYPLQQWREDTGDDEIDSLITILETYPPLTVDARTLDHVISYACQKHLAMPSNAFGTRLTLTVIATYMALFHLPNSVADLRRVHQTSNDDSAYIIALENGTLIANEWRDDERVTRTITRLRRLNSDLADRHRYSRTRLNPKD